MTAMSILSGLMLGGAVVLGLAATEPADLSYLLRSEAHRVVDKRAGRLLATAAIVVAYAAGAIW